MIFLDELEPMELYSRPYYLPIIDNDKLKGSAIFLLTPDYTSSNKLFNNKLFNCKYFSSYYIEKDITYIINQEGAIDLLNNQPYNVLTESGEEKLVRSLHKYIGLEKEEVTEEQIKKETEELREIEKINGYKKGVNRVLLKESTIVESNLINKFKNKYSNIYIISDKQNLSKLTDPIVIYGSIDIKVAISHYLFKKYNIDKSESKKIIIPDKYKKSIMSEKVSLYTVENFDIKSIEYEYSKLALGKSKTAKVKSEKQYNSLQDLAKENKIKIEFKDFSSESNLLKSEAKKLYSEAKKLINTLKYKKGFKIDKEFDKDISQLENGKDEVALVVWDIWEFANNARSEEVQKEFYPLLDNFIEELQSKVSSSKLCIKQDGDWDDGFIYLKLKKNINEETVLNEYFNKVSTPVVYDLHVDFLSLLDGGMNEDKLYNDIKVIINNTLTIAKDLDKKEKIDHQVYQDIIDCINFYLPKIQSKVSESIYNGILNIVDNKEGLKSYIKKDSTPIENNVATSKAELTDKFYKELKKSLNESSDINNSTKLYHGSQIQNLKYLKPKAETYTDGIKADGIKRVYATNNEIFAYIFAAPLEYNNYNHIKFGKMNGIPYIEEKHKDAFKNAFMNRKASIYTVDPTDFKCNKDICNFELISNKTVKVENEKKVKNIWDELLKFEKQGKLSIKHYSLNESNLSKGDNYSWKSWDGEKYEGIITDIEDDCIHVKCNDGKERAVGLNESSDIIQLDDSLESNTITDTYLEPLDENTIVDRFKEKFGINNFKVDNLKDQSKVKQMIQDIKKKSKNPKDFITLLTNFMIIVSLISSGILSIIIPPLGVISLLVTVTIEKIVIHNLDLNNYAENKLAIVLQKIEAEIVKQDLKYSKKDDFKKKKEIKQIKKELISSADIIYKERRKLIDRRKKQFTKDGTDTTDYDRNNKYYNDRLWESSDIVQLDDSLESNTITDTYLESYIDGNKSLIIFNEALEDEEVLNESDAKYNSIIKRLIYDERYKNGKEVFQIYKKIKETNMWLKYGYLNYKRYKALNLIIDLSFYNKTFFKNNIYKLDKGIDLYIDFISRFIFDKRIDKAGYKQRTIMIPVLDWTKEEYKVYNYTKELNPISIIYKLMLTNIEKLYEFGKNTEFVFYSDTSYFSVYFRDPDFVKADSVKFKTLIDKMINKDFVPTDVSELTPKDDLKDSKKAIITDIVDKIQSSQGIKINNLTGDSQDSNKNELIKKIDKAASISTSTKDAIENLENDDEKEDNDFKKIIDTLKDQENDAVQLNAVRKARITKLQDDFMNKNVNGTSIKDLLSESSVDTELPTTSLNIDTVNDEWDNLKFTNFNKAYNVQEDIVRIINCFSNKTVPVVARDIKIEDTSTSEDYIDTYSVPCEDAYGKRFTLKFDMPKLVDNKFLMLRGNEKTINGQEMLLPVEKTDEDTCQIVSNYNKIFIRRFGNSRGKSFVTADRILKTLKKDKYSFDVVYGDNSKICSKYEVPIDYIDLSTSISKIDSKLFTIYFNQDEIRNKFKDKIEKSKGIPIGYNKRTKTIIYYSGNGMISDTILRSLRDDNKFSEVFKTTKPGKKYTYSKASILSNEIPLIVIMGFAEGLVKAMNKAHINYSIEEKRHNLFSHEDVIKFKDGYVYYILDYDSSLLMNGLKECDTENYSLMDLNNKSMFLDFLDIFGGRLLADGLDNFYDLLIDPITKEVLEYYKLPTDYVSILAYANSLLADNKYIKHTDMSGKRYRSTEIIAGYLYKVLSKSYGDYRNSLRRNRSGSTMTIKQSAVIDAILLDPTASDLSTLNALLDLECTNAISTKGLSGMNGDRSYSLDKRTYDDSMMGLLGLSTGFAGNVGITRQTVVDMNVTNKRGYMKIDKNPNDLTITKAFTATEGVTPFGVTRDDPFRSAMTFIQTAKHGMKTKKGTPMLISNGMDQALPYLISNKFAYKAKMEGKVVEKTDEYIVLEYKDGSHDFVDLRDIVKKNSDGGFYLTLKLDSDLKLGSKVKPNQIVAYDKLSFSDNIGPTKDLAYNSGLMTKIAILNTDEGYEDSAIISNYLSDAMSSDVVAKVPVTLPKNTNIYKMVKIGDHVEEGDPLLIFQNAFDDDDVNILLKNLVDDPNEISDLGRIPIKSKVTGTIQDIKISRTIDKSELSDSIKKAVDNVERPINKLSKVLDKYDIDFKNRYKASTLDTTGKLKNAQDSVLIEFFIKHHDKLGVGDKIIYYSALKGVNKDIFPIDKEPYSDYRPNEKIHSLLSLGSVSARMVCSVKVVGSINKVLIELDRHVKELAGVKWKNLDELI